MPSTTSRSPPTWATWLGRSRGHGVRASSSPRSSSGNPRRTSTGRMAAAALAEGGLPDEARGMMGGADPPESSSGPGALKVLLVDDEEDYVREPWPSGWRCGRWGVTWLCTGEEALAMLEEDLPDVIVLDLKMPGMGGMEVLERVKTGFPPGAGHHPHGTRIRQGGGGGPASRGLRLSPEARGHQRADGDGAQGGGGPVRSGEVRGGSPCRI